MLNTQTIAAGDGANDLEMLEAAAIGVAYHAKPVVRVRASYAISHAGWTRSSICSAEALAQVGEHGDQRGASKYAAARGAPARHPVRQVRVVLEGHLQRERYAAEAVRDPFGCE